jgi:hypoxanthine-DNA glycosylase
MTSPLLLGLPPVIGDEPRVLILGTFPGVLSLRRQEYYANQRNAFWTIMGELVGAHRELSYEQRLAALRRRHVALWDVIHRCRREGSGDKAITDATINDFTRLFAMHPGIKRVCFNGRRPEAAFRRFLAERPALAARLDTLELVALPSTSSAHAVKPREKLRRWRVVVAR